MFVRKMFGPEDQQAGTVADPKWLQVREAILRLDNQSCTALILSGEKRDPSLNICGGRDVWIEEAGWDALCLVWATDAGGAVYDLYDPTMLSQYSHLGEIALRLAGQETEQDVQACVNRTTALQAAETFYAQGIRDPSLYWYQDKP